MKTVVSLLLLGSISLFPALAESAGRGPVPISYAEMWRRANQVFASHGISVTRSDSDLGVIEGIRRDGAMKDWFSCPQAGGVVESEGYSVTILLDSVGPESTNVRVNAFGITMWYRNRYFLVFRKSPQRGEIRCQSTGKLEQLLFSELTTLDP